MIDIIEKTIKKRHVPKRTMTLNTRNRGTTLIFLSISLLLEKERTSYCLITEAPLTLLAQAHGWISLSALLAALHRPAVLCCMHKSYLSRIIAKASILLS